MLYGLYFSKPENADQNPKNADYIIPYNPLSFSHSTLSVFSVALTIDKIVIAISLAII